MRRRARFASQRGSAAVLFLVSLTAMLGVIAVAVDGGRLFALRAELQTAVDAAALAGAIELARGGGENARTVAIEYAGLNEAENTPVVVPPDQVTFGTWDRETETFNPLPDASGADAVKVVARREVQHWLSWILNLRRSTASAGAVAWGGAPIGETNCVKPWAIPYELLDANRDGTLEDWEIDAALGDEFRLKTASEGGTGDEIDESGIPSFFYAVVLPPFWRYDPESPGGGYYQDVSGSTGGAEYRTNIATCHPDPIGVGDSLLVEPGNMPGPTIQGARDLCGEIIGTACNPYGTYCTGDGMPGCLVAAGLWKSDFDPIGRRAVEVALLGAFRLLEVYPQSSHAVIIGRFEGLITTGGIGEESTTLVKVILVR